MPGLFVIFILPFSPLVHSRSINLKEINRYPEKCPQIRCPNSCMKADKMIPAKAHIGNAKTIIKKFESMFLSS
jgi:hypothetical protein